MALLPGMTSLSPVPTSSHATNLFPLLNSTYSIDSVSWLAGRRESTSSIDWDLTTKNRSSSIEFGGFSRRGCQSLHGFHRFDM